MKRKRSQDVKRNDLEIDQMRLDREWAEQPNLFHQYADQLADAKKELDILTNRKEELKAKLYHVIASDPDRFHLAKVSEPAIASAIVIHPKMVAINSQIVEAKAVAAKLNAKVQACDDRKKALENLVKLFLADYGATPQISTGDRYQLEERRKRRFFDRTTNKAELDDDDE